MIYFIINVYLAINPNNIQYYWKQLYYSHLVNHVKENTSHLLLNELFKYIKPLIRHYLYFSKTQLQ